MSIYINDAAREKYNRNLLSFAHIQEALPLADKIIFSTSARLLDPYASTTAESRSNLLTRYPILRHGNLKRVFLAGLTDTGYFPEKDKDLLLNTLSQHQVKPLEPYLHINNQRDVIYEDMASIKGSIRDTPDTGFTLVYNDEDSKIPDDLLRKFEVKLQMIEEELPAIHLLKNEFENLGHLEQMNRTGLIILSPTFMIEAAQRTKIITKDQAVEFLSKQKALISQEIENALNRKVKDERRTTTVLRAYEFVISAYLKENQA